jgi:hypothetical protein
MQGSGSLAAALAALGGDESFAESIPPFARANPNADAADLIDAIAAALPAVAERVGVGYSTSYTCCVCQAPTTYSELRPMYRIDIGAPRHSTLHGAMKYASEPGARGGDGGSVDCARAPLARAWAGCGYHCGVAAGEHDRGGRCGSTR